RLHMTEVLPQVVGIGLPRLIHIQVLADGVERKRPAAQALQGAVEVVQVIGAAILSISYTMVVMREQAAGNDGRRRLYALDRGASMNENGGEIGGIDKTAPAIGAPALLPPGVRLVPDLPE